MNAMNGINRINGMDGTSGSASMDRMAWQGQGMTQQADGPPEWRSAARGALGAGGGAAGGADAAGDAPAADAAAGWQAVRPDTASHARTARHRCCWTCSTSRCRSAASRR